MLNLTTLTKGRDSWNKKKKHRSRYSPKYLEKIKIEKGLQGSKGCSSLNIQPKNSSELWGSC